MSLTKANPIDDLARSLFDAAVVSLAQARQAAKRSGYFPDAPDPAAESYFTPVDPAADGRPQASAFPGGGRPAGLIDALSAYWAEQGEAELAAMAPALKELADAIAAERGQQSGDVDIYCYTMF